ncbi:MAG TPA: YjbF family lipoprotein [Rhizomicrobium sp.]|nr:YjbF family lipoprotein [Rhizomicrobium sp.]
MIRPALWAAAPAIALLMLSGCSADSDYGAYFQLVKQSFSNGIGNSGVSREQAAAIPYASLGYRLDDGSEAMLVLATDTNGEQLWTSSAHVVFLSQDGRVKRTTGLPHNLGALIPVRGPSLPAPASALEGPSTNIFTADFPDIGSYSVAITCRLNAKERETIAVLGQPIPTTRVDEDCVSPNPQWRFRNSYWLDAQTGFVWRSIQHIHPKGDTLQIEIFRPPG